VTDFKLVLMQHMAISRAVWDSDSQAVVGVGRV